MAKQIIHLLIFIALVGQSLLSPAMAMPEFLHSISHKVAEQPVVTSQKHQTATEAGDIRALIFTDGQIVHCDQPCMILASGHCVTHCTLLTGIVIHSPLILIRSTSSEPVPNRLWSIQTAESTPDYRPPIA
ncbi:hypothetical protein [Shewanella sp. UCD-KL12]|uniref:hypothetical protein n=1 Tax=Shewanella sp. UCD-KL12 TaxID=1917163 RepID=UPI0009708DD8|nr:hypothetical protein [Shewanella sp. UCD-KL12]